LNVASEVLINDLANLPHSDGQTVLHAKRADFEVKVIFSGTRYRVYGFVIQPNGGTWTNLAADRPTVQEARDLAARLWADGKDFNVTVG
jgi:hypothetical protein